jgi:leucyl aminopeptidase (aminopeptidase T)
MDQFDSLQKQTHLSFWWEIFEMWETAKSMDLLTQRLCELATIEWVKDRVNLISWDVEGIEKAREICLLKKKLYTKLLEDLEKQYTKEDWKILIQVPLSHAWDFIPYLIEQRDNLDSKFSKLNIEYVIVDPESIDQISNNEEDVKRLYDHYLKKTRAADKFIQIVDSWSGPEKHAPEDDKKGVWRVYGKYKAEIAWTEKLRLYFPTQEMADAEGMILAEFYKLYIDACSLDWERIKEWNEELAELFRKYDKVHVEWEGTCIDFDITGMWAQNSVIETNYPGSETYSAPIRNGTNGYITYGETNVPMINEVVKWLKLTFIDGRLESFEILWEYPESERDRISQKFDDKLNEHDANRYLWEIAFWTNFMVPVWIKHSLIWEKAAWMHIALWRAFAKWKPGDKGYVDNWNNKNWKNPATIHCDLIRAMNDWSVVTFSKKLWESIEVMNNAKFSSQNTPILANYQQEILQQGA